MTPHRAAELVAQFSDVMQFCLAHQAQVSVTTIYVIGGSRDLTVTLKDPGTLPEYFDSQRQPVTYVHGSAGGPRVQADWRDCRITWPVPVGYPLEV